MLVTKVSAKSAEKIPHHADNMRAIKRISKYICFPFAGESSAQSKQLSVVHHGLDSRCNASGLALNQRLTDWMHWLFTKLTRAASKSGENTRKT